jgi:photosystem II stability/assembly factor-like uncharacterized protein
MLLLDGALVGSAIVAVGERGTIVRSSDLGKTWQTAPRVTKAALTAVGFSPENGSLPPRGWAVGHDAIIIASTDEGRTWSKQFQGANLEESFLDVLPIDVEHVIAIGANRLFLETKDGGTHWSRREVVADETHLNRITCGPTGTLYIAGEHGTLLRSTDRGATWTVMASPNAGSFYGVLPLAPRNLLAYGLRGRAYRSLDNGLSWESIATPSPALIATGIQLQNGLIVLGGSGARLMVGEPDAKAFREYGASRRNAVAEILELPNGNLLTLGEGGATIVPKPD